MKDLTIRNIAKACRGSYHGPAELLDREVTGVSTDSRTAAEGCLFVPIKGERVDGHSYITKAMENGALLTLTEHAEGMPAGFPYILVGKTTEAIQEIAGFYRRSLSAKVVGITGSVGKTSTKEMIAAVLSEKYRVLKTEGNFNNNLGLPLTVFRMTPETEVAVLEMGISHFGEMTWLAETAEPDIMVITNIGECHTEFLGDRDGVLRAKTECLDYVKNDGVVILCGEDDKLRTVKEVHGRRPVFYGLDPSCRVYAEEITPFGIGGSRVRVNSDDDVFEVEVPMPGTHMVLNALAGVAAGAALGLTNEEIRAGIAKAGALKGHFRIEKINGITLIDDSYNASPMSVRAALDVLAAAGSEKVAVLGDMGELGEREREIHRELGRYAGSLGIKRFITVGPLSEETTAGIREADPEAQVSHFSDVDSCLMELSRLIHEGDAVLVKASHFMKFDRISAALSGGEEVK
ncbi:MAG: UDP-N-acetylmuramoyl-tripeptide--D-alanyl-D-alanine ligase [Lachnospiraceae bacterium]|nr:UDP-N-acetylmuramoyl-tripeptide--D-alanyl-D-alanine ligase [Lachnospiraceae bacterium]